MNRLEDTKPMAIKRPFCRAKIFQPFDALPGLLELLRKKEREHERAFYQDAANETIANGKHSERCAFGSAICALGNHRNEVSSHERSI